MSERKVVSASHPYYAMDDGTLWRGSIGPVGIGRVEWTRIPGPPADPETLPDMPDGFWVMWRQN